MICNSPLVSILINNYNYRHCLADAIDSALNQSYANVEVIVVDDGSTDNSRDLIHQYGDRVVSVFKQNGGQASAFNAGFIASQGDIVCFLDADDLFLPERVDFVVGKFQAYPHIDWVFTESAPIQTAQIVKSKMDSLLAMIRQNSSLEESDQVDFRAALLAGKIPNFTPSTSNLCFSRSILEKIFPLPEIKGFSGMAITDLYIKSLAVGLGIGCITKRDLGIYRFHNNYYKTLGADKKRRMFGEIYTTTGYWMKQRFPDFSQISKKFLAKGFAAYLGSSYLKQIDSDADCDRMFNNYLKAASNFEKLEIYLLLAYYLFRLRTRKFA